ncbi:MAG TPA: HEAT repeat domain-containing protein [Labilithrix sp.]
MRRGVMVLGTSILLFCEAAHAERTVVPPGGGLDAMELHVDVPSGVVRLRRCKSADCGDTGTLEEIAIPIEKSRIDVAHATVETVAVGEGRRVAHVRLPDAERKDLAFELVASGASSKPIFAGLTGYTRGSEGDRAGDVVLFYDRDGATKFVIVAETREDTRICGQAVTPLGARGLDPHTMELRGATLHRIDKKARDEAQPVVAALRAADARPPLARVLAATGGSAPHAQALTDGDPKTAWIEQRPGDGHGEFVTMRAPSELPLRSLIVTSAPKTEAGAAPRTFFVATDARLFHITMPEDAWNKPGATYDIPFPEPVKTTCVAFVLDEAYVRGQGAPEVGIAELGATTAFDAEKATLDDVVKALAGPRADEAAALLKRAGDDGLAAVVRAYASLDAKSRAFGIDVAASAGTCNGAAAELLTRGLSDRESEVRRRALGRLERCGKNASEALAAAVRSDDEPRRAAAAPLLATVSPALAIEALADEMGKGAPETRKSVRAAFSRAAASSTRDKLLGYLAVRDASPIARLDMLRAIGPKLAELRPESDAAIAELLRTQPSMDTRYLLVQPLANLARAPDATSGELTRLAELARRDPDWPVRARAVELAAGIAPLMPTIAQATSDPEPRVREAALHAIGESALAAAAPAAQQLLAKDDWTFVRVAAAEALGKLATSPESLDAALSDASPRVRSAAIVALGQQHATRYAAHVRDRLEDGKEDPDVRALAARTLGAMCDAGALDRLTKLADRARFPTNDADDRIGIAAIEALGAIHPSDLQKRLAPLLDKGVRMPVRRAAERALSETPACR